MVFKGENMCNFLIISRVTALVILGALYALVSPVYANTQSPINPVLESVPSDSINRNNNDNNSNDNFSNNVVVEPNTPELLLQLHKKSIEQNIAHHPLGQIMKWVALQLLNQPYVNGLLDLHQPEYVYISLTNTDCMLFIEEVLVASMLIKANKLTLPNFITYIKRVRYHGNEEKPTYCTRNHYFKDWALDNIQKKMVVDIALPLTKIVYPYKAEIISNNLKRSPHSPHYVDLKCIVERERYINTNYTSGSDGYTHKLGFIPLKLLPKYLNKIQDGDIIGIVRASLGSTKVMNSDAIHHLGIALVGDNGEVGMINASSLSTKRKVIITTNLMSYLARFSDSQGIILLRAK